MTIVDLFPRAITLKVLISVARLLLLPDQHQGAG